MQFNRSKQTLMEMNLLNSVSSVNPFSSLF